MSWRIRLAAFVAAAASFLSLSTQAQILYAATGTAGTPGVLYQVAPATGQTSPVGPILVGGLPIAITGLAVNPQTGVLYGVTANASPNLAQHLVSISTLSGVATDIGALGTGLADIAFRLDGILYGVSGNNANLWRINLSTGVATIVGTTGFTSSGGAFAINPVGVAVTNGNGASGTLDSINLQTGARTAGPVLSGAPQPGNNLNSASFNSAGQLFAVNGNGAPSNLVTINVATGVVTDVGLLPDFIDALAFATPMSAVPTMSEWAMILMALLLAVTGFVAMRRRG